MIHFNSHALTRALVGILTRNTLTINPSPQTFHSFIIWSNAPYLKDILSIDHDMYSCLNSKQKGSTTHTTNIMSQPPNHEQKSSNTGCFNSLSEVYIQLIHSKQPQLRLFMWVICPQTVLLRYLIISFYFIL